MLKIVVLLASSFVASFCHSPPNEKLKEEVDCSQAPDILSWHIHVMYDELNERIKKHSLALLEKFVAKFGDELGPPCEGLFHQENLCLYPPESAGGPFPVAQWAVSIPLEHYISKVAWFAQHRSANGTKVDLFIHPNSGCLVPDHTDWALWGGDKWQVNEDFLATFTGDKKSPKKEEL
eukprot:gene14478-5541_t